MNLEDFKKDAEILVHHYIAEDLGDPKALLDIWIKVRGYKDDEYDLLIYLIEDLLTTYINKANNFSGPPGDAGYTIPAEAYSIWRLIDDLPKRNIEQSALSLPDVEEKYLDAPIRQELMKQAEALAYEYRLIDENGKWREGNRFGKGRLGTFLIMLEERKIIVSNRPVTEPYFCQRYQCDLLGTQFKPSKAKAYVKEKFFVELAKIAPVIGKKLFP